MRKVIFVIVVCLLLELCLAWIGGSNRGRHGNRGRGRGRHGRRGRHHTGLGDWLSGHRSSRYRWGFGPDKDPWFSLGVDINQPIQHKKNWWSGPNVCYTQDESVENSTAEISTHMSFQSVICDGSDTAFRCSKTETTPQGKKTVTEVYECCSGFTRAQTDFGCPRSVALYDLPSVLETLDLTEMINLLNSTGLDQEIFTSDTNFTIFAPTNKALQSFASTVNSLDKNLKLQDMPNVIMVSKAIQEDLVEDSKNVLLGHIVVGRYTTPQLSDEQLLETGSPYKANIRINTYQSPVKLMTANCKKITSVDNVASNGVVHVVDGVMSPITGTLLDLVSKNPELSTLKTALGSSSLGAELRDDGQYTLFAPTDNAFKKYQSLLKKVMSNSKCLDNVLKNHLLPHVICSTVIEGEARTHNLLQKYANLTRDSNNKLYVDGAQVVSADIMASNGVLHIIDDVLLPDEALSLLDLAEKNDLTEFVNLVMKAGFKKELSNLENVTVFVPSNDAIKALPQGALQTLTQDPDKLKDVLQYHVALQRNAMSRTHHNLQVKTALGPKLRVNEYSRFPFGRHWTRTVQCARFDDEPITGCSGAMYVIDRVLMPPKGKVVDVLAQDARFSTLVALLKMTSLADRLQLDGPFTVFAPTNKAFDNLGSDAVVEMKQNKGVLEALLLNHVVGDTLCCAGILKTNWLNTQKVQTFSETYFEIRKTRHGKNYIGNTDIIECDLPATNGVVHVVGDVIIGSPPTPEPLWEYFWY